MQKKGQLAAVLQSSTQFGSKLATRDADMGGAATAATSGTATRATGATATTLIITANNIRHGSWGYKKNGMAQDTNQNTQC